jgi:hypothetical protein
MGIESKITIISGVSLIIGLIIMGEAFVHVKKHAPIFVGLSIFIYIRLATILFSTFLW